MWASGPLGTKTNSTDLSEPIRELGEAAGLNRTSKRAEGFSRASNDELEKHGGKNAFISLP